MDWLQYLVAAIFFLLGAGCLLLVILQLPGGWILLGIALGIEMLDHLYLSGPEAVTFGWPVLLISLALLGLGELLEFIAGTLGASKSGASRRGMIGSLVGGIAGALLLAIPLAFLGPFGMLLGAIIGTFVGAIVGETTGQEPRSTRDSLRPATGAAIGRILGTVGKTGLSMVVWILLTAAAFWP